LVIPKIINLDSPDGHVCASAEKKQRFWEDTLGLAKLKVVDVLDIRAKIKGKMDYI